MSVKNFKYKVEFEEKRTEFEMISPLMMKYKAVGTLHSCWDRVVQSKGKG